MFQQCVNSNKSRLLYFNWPRESAVDCSPHSRHCQAKQLPACPALWQGQLNINLNQGVADACCGCKDFWGGCVSNVTVKHEANLAGSNLGAIQACCTVYIHMHTYWQMLLNAAYICIPIHTNTLPVGCNKYNSATNGYRKCIALLLSLNPTESNINKYQPIPT